MKRFDDPCDEEYKYLHPVVGVGGLLLFLFFSSLLGTIIGVLIWIGNYKSFQGNPGVFALACMMMGSVVTWCTMTACIDVTNRLLRKRS